MAKTAARVSLYHPEIQTQVREDVTVPLTPCLPIVSPRLASHEGTALASCLTQPPGNVSEQNVSPVALLPTSRCVPLPLESTWMGERQNIMGKADPHGFEGKRPTSLFQMSPCRLAFKGKTIRTRRQVQVRASKAAEPLLLLQGEEREELSAECQPPCGDNHSSRRTAWGVNPPSS